MSDDLADLIKRHSGPTLYVRMYNCLHYAEIYSIEDFLRISLAEMQKRRMFGKRCAAVFESMRNELSSASQAKMEYKDWSARYKAIAKYYRRQLQIASGERCEFCEKKLLENSE